MNPQVYMPFQELLLWLQLEVSRKNYKEAEEIVKKYIANTTNLIDDETKGVISLDLKRKDGPKDPWKPKPEILDLKESQYYKLIDVYLFDILLPDRGYDEAKEILMKEIAMDKAMKFDYLDKLGEYYRTSVRETSMMHGTEAIEQLNKARIKSQLKDRVDEIKSLPHQQGENERNAAQNLNPLYQSTFLRATNTHRPMDKNSEDEGGISKFLMKFKAHVNTKTFMAIMTLVLMYWMWKGGYRKLKRIGMAKFVLLHVFGIKD